MPDQTSKTEPEYITRQQAAELAKVDIRTIDRWTARGLIKTKRPRIIRGKGGTRVLLRATDVQTIINAGSE